MRATVIAKTRAQPEHGTGQAARCCRTTQTTGTDAPFGLSALRVRPRKSPQAVQVLAIAGATGSSGPFAQGIAQILHALAERLPQHIAKVDFGLVASRDADIGETDEALLSGSGGAALQQALARRRRRRQDPLLEPARRTRLLLGRGPRAPAGYRPAGVERLQYHPWHVAGATGARTHAPAHRRLRRRPECDQPQATRGADRWPVLRAEQRTGRPGDAAPDGQHDADADRRGGHDGREPRCRGFTGGALTSVAGTLCTRGEPGA